MILLDTHTLIWLDQGNGKLGERARAQIDAALQENELAVSAISFWETGMLIDKGRLIFSVDPHAWRHDLLRANLREIPVDGNIAINSTRLNNFPGDPADRLIAATAMQHSAALVTADEQLLGWYGPLNKIDARR